MSDRAAVSGQAEQLRLDVKHPAVEAEGLDETTPEQRKATSARDRSVFLEAGAGTGKTRVLVDRYCETVASDGVAPERILAFTFTERAAGEMRRRVRDQLARRAAAAELAGDRERARELSAFARAGESSMVTTIHGFCRRLLAAHPAAAGVDPRFRVLDATETSRLAAEAFAQAVDGLAAEDDSVPSLTAGYNGPRLLRLVLAAYEDHRSRGVLEATLPDVAVPESLEDYGEDAVEDVAGLVRGLRSLVEEFDRRFGRLKAMRSGLDFDDLQIRALQLLRAHPAIRDSYAERFEHVLVDEFQDTNPVQVALVTELRNPETKLFTVGDEFQAIYGFRHADLELFRAQRERVRAREREGDAAVLQLRGSFRSSPDVVGAVNAIGAALLDEFAPLTVGTANPPQPVGEGPAVELLLTERSGWDDQLLGRIRGEGPPRRVAEARFLAKRLRALAETGEPLGGMVVLLRAFTHVATYEDELRRAGLNPLIVGGRGYWSHQQVDDALRILACVANPLDDESLLGTLASPAVGLSADALMVLRLMAGEHNHLWPIIDRGFAAEPELEGDASRWAAEMPEADADRLRGFRGRLEELRIRAPVVALNELLTDALTTLEYDIDTLFRDDGSRRLANAQKLAQLAAEYEAHEGRDLRGFLDAMAMRAAATDREPEASTESEGHDGVRVMTVHAAKGLEFDVVAVADLGRSLLAGGARPDVRLGYPRDGSAEPGRADRIGLRLSRAARAPLALGELEALEEQAAGAESAESRRLAYVAASRARRRLLLSGLFSPKDLEAKEEVAHSASVLARLLPGLGVRPEETEIEVAAPEPREGLAASYPRVRVAVTFNDAESGAIGPEIERFRARVDARPPPSGTPPLLPAVAADPAAERHVSYAALSDYRRCGYRYYVERVLGLREARGAVPPADEEGSAPAREPDEFFEADTTADATGGEARRLGFGNAVHSLLEGASRARWAPPTRDAIMTALRREGLPGSADEAERAQTLVGAWLSSELLAELQAKRARVRPEVPFLLPIGGDTIVRGTIDLLVEAPGRAPLFVDYKTDAVGKLDPAALVSARYEIQRGLYGLALASATGADAVESAYVFLEAPEAPVRGTLGESELAGARRELEADVDGVRSGRFEATDSPHAGLCLDCPARERLCSYESERTLAGLGDEAESIAGR